MKISHFLGHRRVESKNQERRTKSLRRAFLPCLERLEDRLTPAPIPVSVSASMDNTLYSEGALSDALGQFLYVGRTGTKDSGSSRRAVIEFDLPSNIPVGAAISNVQLSLDMSKPGGNPQTISVYALTQSWTDGTSNAQTNPVSPKNKEGGGAPATNGDPTWLDETYSSDPTKAVAWTSPGGTHAGQVSASQNVTTDLGVVHWSGSQLTQDVQQWVNNRGSNHGWILIGDESTSQTAMQFDSIHNGSSDNVVNQQTMPLLTFTYTPLTIVTTSLPPWTVNQHYSQVITAAGGAGSYVFSSSGTVPPGFQPISPVGVITGTPAAPGTFQYTVTVKDALGTTATQTYSLTINPPPSLGNLTQTEWTVNQQDFLGSIAINGGTMPDNVSLPIANLPTGLSATVSGNAIVIRGTPTVLGDYAFTISGTDGARAPFGGNFDIDIHEPGPRVFHVNTMLDTHSVAPHNAHDTEQNGNISLRSAIEAAASDAGGSPPETDTILVPAGVYIIDSTLDVSGTMNILAAPGVNPDQVQVRPGAKDVLSTLISVDFGVVATIAGLEIAGAQPGQNGAINNAGTLYLNRSAVVHNLDSGILNNGTLVLSDSFVAYNSANDGGGVFNVGTLTVRNSTFSTNSAAVDGGAIASLLGSVTIDNSTFTANSASLIGGAIYSGTDLTVTTSTIAFNSAGIAGGGIDVGFNSPNGANLTGDIVVGNIDGSPSAPRADDVTGPGLQNISSFNLIGADTTGSLRSGVNGNEIGASVADAGLANLDEYGGPTLTLALLPSSHALGNGGAVTTLSAPVTDPTATSLTVSNGLVFAASSLPDLTTGWYFMIQIDDEQMAVTGLQLNDDGSATLSVIRGSNADVRANGAEVYLASDQRGFTRPAGQAADIGAFQSIAGLMVNTTADDFYAVGPGQLSLRSAIDLANVGAAPPQSSIPFDPITFATPETIALVSPLSISTPTPLQINGPSALLIISSPADPNTGANLGGIVVAAGGVVTLNGNFMITAPLDVAGPSSLLAAASLTIAQNGTTTLDGGPTIEGSLVVDGTLDVSDTGTLVVNLGGLLDVAAGAPGVTLDGALVVFGNVNVEQGYTDAGGNLVPGGILDVKNQLTVQGSGLLTDAGTVTVGAILSTSGTLEDLGKIIIAAASTDASNNTQAAGSLNIFSLVDVSFSGLIYDYGTLMVGFFVDTAALLKDRGVVAIEPASTDAGNHPQPAGFLDVYGTFTVEPPVDIFLPPTPSGAGGVLHLPGGNLNESGQVTVESGGLLDDENRVTVDAGILDIYGTLSTIQSAEGPGSPSQLIVSSDAQVIVHPSEFPDGVPGILDDTGEVTVDVRGKLTDMGTVSVNAQGSIDDQGRFFVTGLKAKLTVNVSGTFSMDSDADLKVTQAASATIFGQLTTHLANVTVDTGGVIDDAGSFVLHGELDVAATNGNAGTFSIEAGSDFDELGGFSFVFVDGTFQMLGGTATIGDEFDVNPGGTVIDGGSFDVAGTGTLVVAAAAGGLPEGDFTVSSALTLDRNASATIAGLLAVDSNANLEVTGGATLADLQQVFMDGTMDVAAATSQFSAGTVTLDSGSTLNVSFGAIATIEGNLNVAGNLEVNGKLTENTLEIGQGGDLLGIGTIAAAITVDDGGILAPGFDIGVLDTDSLTLNSGSAFNAELLSPDSGNYSQDSVTGSVFLGGATLNLSGTNLKASAGDEYVLINNDGSDVISGSYFVAGAGVDGVTTGSRLSEGTLLSTNFLGSGRTARITYQAGPGNNSVAILFPLATPTIDQFPRNPSNRVNATFAFSDTDTGVTLLTRLDNGDFAPSSGSQAFSFLNNGQHTFYVEARDEAGHTSDIASYTWTVQANPSVVLNLPPGAQGVIEDKGASADNVSQLRSLNQTFNLTTFDNPWSSLTINTAGNSTVQINTDNDFAPPSETFNGQAGDTIQFTRAEAVPAALSVLTITNSLVDLNGFSTTVGAFQTNGLVLTDGRISTGNGTLTLASNIKDDAIPAGTPAMISGHLSLGGGTRTVDVQPGDLQANPHNTDTNNLIISALISDGGSPAGLIKNNAGSLELDADNTYTGSTIVNAGTLSVDGTQPSSAVMVNAGAILGGTGNTGPITVAGGTVNPGDPVGNLATLSGVSADFSNNGNLMIALAGATGNIRSDKLNLSGPLILGGTSTLILDVGGLTTSTGSPITIIQDSSCTGTFSTVQVINNLNNLQAIVNCTPGTVTVTLVGAPDHLAFGVQPTMTIAGVTISPAVTVQVLDYFGNLVSNDTSNVSLAIAANPAGGMLGGARQAAAVGGVATFGSLSIDKTGVGYTLAGSDGSVTGAISSPFNIIPAVNLNVEDASGQPLPGAAIQNVTVTPEPSGAPQDLIFPDGSLGFTVTGLNPGAAAQVVIQFPAGFFQTSTNYAYYKYDGASQVWTPFDLRAATQTSPQTGALIDPANNRVVLYLVDNGRGDSDDRPGIIVDPGSLAITPVTATISNVPAASPVGTAITLNSTVGDSADPAGPFSYSWQVAKLQAGGIPVLVQSQDGPLPSFQFTPTSVGSYVVTLTAADRYGAISNQTSRTITVIPATPVITWPSPSAIVQGTALGAAQLDAVADVPGTFAYSPPAGTVLAAGTQSLSVTFTPADTVDYNSAKAKTEILVVGTGLTAAGTDLYVVDGSTENSDVHIRPAGTSKTGSTGIHIDGTLNHVKVSAPFNQAFTAIRIFGYGGNDNFHLAHSLTINTFVSAGDGNDNIQLGDGNNTVVLGNGNDGIRAGSGTNVVTVGNGNDDVRLRNGNNTVTAGNGNDNVQVGDGNNIVVTGNGNNTIQAGDGDNLIAGGLGRHTIQAGNGSNILIDGNVQLTQSGDTLVRVLNDWMLYRDSHANVANIRARLKVTDNNSHANTLTAGSGLDWFWATYSQDHTNRKVTDLLN